MMVWVGLISYPLYLFHWPVLSFLHIVKGVNPAPGFIWAALGVALLLTVLTYYFIEKKLRHNKGRWVLPLLVGAFLATGLFGAVVWSGEVGLRLDPRIVQTVTALKDKDFFQGMTQHNSQVGLFTVGGNGPQTVFVGDSNMEQYMPRMSSVLSPNTGAARGAIFIVYAGLPAIPGMSIGQYRKGLSLFPELEDQLRLHPSIDRVVFGCLWPEYFTTKQNSVEGMPATDPAALEVAMNALGNEIAKLRSTGKQVTLLLTIAYGSNLDPRTFLERSWFGIKYVGPKMLSKEEFLATKKQVLEKVKETAIRNGATVIDPLQYLESDGVCLATDDSGMPVQYDGRHLRPGYVREHVKYLDQTIAP
jgi:hypothetical protein